MSVQKLNQNTFNNAIANGTALVDFYADWCGPCRMVSPIVDEIAEERSDITVGKVNVDDENALSMKYGVMSIPTLIVFKDGKEKTYYIYNVCDHQECYHEVGSQAISYTTGVPAMCGALMMLTGKWIRPGVYTVEEFDPDPFLEALDRYGLPRSESHDPELVD